MVSVPEENAVYLWPRSQTWENYLSIFDGLPDDVRIIVCHDRKGWENYENNSSIKYIFTETFFAKIATKLYIVYHD